MHYNHEEYFEDCATRYKRISHSPQKPRFFISLGLASMDGLINNLSSANYPCIIAEKGPDKRLRDNRSDNMMWQPFFSFLVLYPTEPGNEASVRTARDTAEADANRIISRMVMEARSNLKGLALLNEESIHVQGVGPLGDCAHGAMVTFTLLESANLIFNNDDWHEQI